MEREEEYRNILKQITIVKKKIKARGKKRLLLPEEIKVKIKDFVNKYNIHAPVAATMFNVSPDNMYKWIRGENLRTSGANGGVVIKVKHNTKALKTRSSSGDGRILGSVLKQMLNDSKTSSNIMQRTELVSNLETAGFNRSELLENTNTLPTTEEWNTIQRAILLLAEEYNITKKE